MNGTQYPGAVDPRMTRMLVPDSTGALDSPVDFTSTLFNFICIGMLLVSDG